MAEQWTDNNNDQWVGGNNDQWIEDGWVEYDQGIALYHLIAADMNYYFETADQAVHYIAVDSAYYYESKP